jgi:tripartite-type tricarboxylate transporter receptor subunit TctC
MIGPAQMPADITNRLVKVFETAANDGGYKRFLLERDVTPAYQPPESIFENLDEQRKVCRTILEKAGMLKE